MASVDTEDDQLLSVIYGDHEPDDWAAKHQISLSELASRLNAKQHFDNRGRQIWTDGAEEATIQWMLFHIGGGTIARSTLAAWRGAASVLMTTGIAPASIEAIAKNFYNPQTGRYGVEIAWSQGVLNTPLVFMDLNVGDATITHRGAIGFNGVTGQYVYLNAAGVFVNVGHPVCQVADIHFWHKIKMVIDIDNAEYVRALFDGHEVDMAGLGLDPIAPLACPRMNVSLTVQGNNVAAFTIHFDDFILSHLEP